MQNFLGALRVKNLLQETEKLNQDRPEVSICFVETVLVWIAYGFLWVAFLPFAMYISHCEEKTLPWTRFQLAKTVSWKYKLQRQMLSEGELISPFHSDRLSQIY